MNEKVKSYLDKGKAALGKVSKKIWIIAAVVIVLVAAGLTIFLNSRPYEVLVTGSNKKWHPLMILICLFDAALSLVIMRVILMMMGVQ